MTLTSIALDGQERERVRRNLLALGQQAKAAAKTLALAPRRQKDDALRFAAKALRRQAQAILAANGRDLEVARSAKRPVSFLDRLTVTQARIESISKSLEEIAALPDPVGAVIAEWTRPNGLKISRVRVPLGVVGLIYESRPNVTADAGALCLKSGNAAILRGGSEAHHTNRAIHLCLLEGLERATLPQACIQLVGTTDRDAVGLMLEGLGGTVDVIVPRGGKSLVERVQREARVPVFAHLEGVNHVYVDKAANFKMAREIVINAKMRRTGVCGAAETLLLDVGGGERLLKPLVQALLDAGCEVRGDEATKLTDNRVKAATESDWSTEYLDAIIAVKTVDGIEGALEHIARYSSQHTEAIVTEDRDTAERFLREVDSAIVLHNASTQFADGGEFGMGAEIGIATGRFHARGPVGLEQLTTFKYAVRGEGQTRPL